MNWDEIFKSQIPRMESADKVYELFDNLGYDTLSKGYKVSKSVFNLRKEESDLVKDIYIISNYKNIFGIYLIVLNRESKSILRTLPELLIRNIRHPLIIFTHDFQNYDFVLLEQKKIDIGKFEYVRTFMHFDRKDLKHTDKLIFKRLALTDENIHQIYELKQHKVNTVEELEKKMYFFFFFIKDVFSIEKVTEDFFKGYEKVFNQLKVFCISESKNAPWAHHFSHQLLNRLMFLYFIQKKEWLGKDPKFIKRFYKTYNTLKAEKKIEPDTFYKDWLSVLFFCALCNSPAGCQRQYFPDDIKSALTLAPYLNGGLFNENRFDRKLDFVIPDNLFEEIFKFFERYNFTIKENLPLEVTVAVDPEMIGIVYEQLVNVSDDINEQGDAGIFYTARTEIDFMCRRSIVEYLANHIPDINKELLYDFVFAIGEKTKEIDEEISKNKLWDNIIPVLESITIVDPACGSGSFLVGMLNILSGLLKRAYSYTQKELPGDYDIKKSIIGKSLYGVDIKEWAVNVAELRLWLQLIIETDLKLEELHSVKPLLPNLSFNIRVGDSLVPDIGGFDIYRKAQNKFAVGSPKSRKFKQIINNHKKEKLKFFNNEKIRKYQSKYDLKFYETELIRTLIDEEIKELRDDINKIDRHLNRGSVQTLNLFGEDRKKSEQTSLENSFKKDDKKIKAELEKDIAELEELMTKIKSKEKNTDMFIWDLAFVEIFSSEKEGFDIVIGNPPYVRQEQIAPPSYYVSNDIFIASEAKQPDSSLSLRGAAATWQSQPATINKPTTEIKKKYKDRLVEEIKHIYPKQIKKIDLKSDLYIYFYFNGLHLLNEKGVFCFITSNSWLDVGYGKDLQEFLLKNAQIHAIYDNSAKRSFSRADVNTIIALFSAPVFREKEALQNIARFVQFRRPFEEVINPYNLKEIEKMESRGYLYEEKTGGSSETEDEKDKIVARVVPMTQQQLLLEGWEWKDNLSQKEEKQKKALEEGRKNGVPKKGKFTGDKWGGKYLRAPDIYYTILEKGKDKLVRLGDIAEVRRGFTTGCNEFFYLPSKHFDIKKTDDGKYYKLIPKHEGLPDDIMIEEGYLQNRIVTKTGQIIKPYIDNKEITHRILVVDEKVDIDKSEGLKQYIKWGENQKIHKRPTCSARGKWYCVGKIDFPPVLAPIGHKRRAVVGIAKNLLADANLNKITPYKVDETMDMVIASSIYSSFIMLQYELIGRANFGQGLLKTQTYEMANVLVLDLNHIDKQLINNLIEKFIVLAKDKQLMYYDDIRRKVRKDFEIAFLQCLGFSDNTETLADELMYETGRIIWERMAKTKNSREMNYPYEEFMKSGKAFALD